VDNYFHKDWIVIIQANSVAGNSWVCLDAWYEFLQYHDHYKATLPVYESVKNTKDINVRNHFLKFQGKVQNAFTALTVKRRQVEWKIQTFTDELNSKSQNQMDYVVSCHCIADRLVRQGVNYIQKNIDAAYSFAYVAVGVAKVHPNIITFIISALHEWCPYSVPMIPPKQSGQTKDEYQAKVLKYLNTLDENSKEVIEPMASYIKRVCGYITLMATIYMIQMGDDFPRIHMAWAWLTRFLQLKIRPYSATLLHAFLQTSNYYLVLVYNNQYIKLLQFIIHDWFRKLDSKDLTPVNQMGISNLKAFLEEAHKNYLSNINEFPEAAKLSDDND
jgi:hypothetical protein